MDQKDFYKQLIQRYVSNQATEEELEAFFHLISSDQMDEELKIFMDEEAAKVEVEQVKVRRLWPRIAVAASVLIALSAGLYVALQHKQENINIAKVDVLPGRNQATLTLGNGKQIVLTRNLTGKLAQQGNTSIGINSGAIAYQAGEPETTIQYNTLTTKRGEVSPYPLVLPDGSKVWLNAASSITFPTAFNGRTRNVTVTGEAYLEIIHNQKQPFTVKTATHTIEDIGTEFDVKAYVDETAATTLISGSVKVNETLLKPGEQVVSGSVQHVDIADVIAWKSGNFHFTDAKLSDILRQASRWYDVDITYENESLKDKKFGAITTRFAKASQLLHVLELTGEVKFKIEGKKITVLNK